MLGQVQVTPGWADDPMQSAEVGQKKTKGEDGASGGRRGGPGGLISVCNNKRRILGP